MNFTIKEITSPSQIDDFIEDEANHLPEWLRKMITEHLKEGFEKGKFIIEHYPKLKIHIVTLDKDTEDLKYKVRLNVSDNLLEPLALISVAFASQINQFFYDGSTFNTATFFDYMPDQIVQPL